MNTLGLDIGGANLKAVYLATENGDENARAANVPFPMWERWKELPQKLKEITATFEVSKHAQVAVTMTGELADCFSTRRAGVEHIANSVHEAFPEHQIAFYQTDGRWCGIESVSENWELLAASNWHAMARLAAGFLPQKSGLMVDVGSTTTDIIPIVDGEVRAIGRTDYQRLRHRELVYAGIGRTPVCSLIQSVELANGGVSIARELFATMDDALIWKNLIPENAEDFNSADGESRSRNNAGRRLARMICSEPEEAGGDELDRIAAATIVAYQAMLTDAIGNALNNHDLTNALQVGTGSFLTDGVLRSQFPAMNNINFGDLVGDRCSESGPAYAVAALLQQDH